MIDYLAKGLRSLIGRFPPAIRMLRRFLPRQFGSYPRPLANEIGAVAAVLHSSQWNMTSGEAHLRLEADFAEYVGVPYAVAVNTGGMGLQMSMRSLDMKPGDEVLLQVDTCSATAFAVMNAGCTPIFTDISARTFMLPEEVELLVGARTRGLVATHMWGNPEDVPMLLQVGARHGLSVIEDACLSLGARVNGRMAGTGGAAGVFSFGCVKPIQGGEGGMIVTHDEGLARELRSLRHWGDRSIDFGVRDTTQLAWNGRMSEIVAAVVREQLRGYPAYLRDLRDALADFQQFLQSIEGMDLMLGNAQSVEDCAFTQIVVRLDESKLPCSKASLRNSLLARGIGSWHANFESIPSMSFFQNGTWRDWILAGDISRAEVNYAKAFPVHQQVYDHSGMGIAKIHFSSKWRLKELKSKLSAILAEA